MRDILITLIIFGSLPLILRNPVNGVLMWVWISVMNPHTQSWGFAATFPFAYIVAIATLFSLACSRLPKTLPVSPITYTLIVLILWMNVTTLFAMFPETAYAQWSKVMKIMLMSLVTMMVIRTRDDVHRLMWVLAMSLGYYGVKGGLFTIRSGGVDRVWGPEGTFIGDNNEIALALIMTIPLLRYLQLRSGGRWLRLALGAAMLLSALAALGSYSRGALLAIAAMIVVMWSKSRHKLAGGLMLAVLVPLALLFMPERWSERMDSIGAYQEDESAMGRINAWYMAWNLAKDRFFGGGFDIAEPRAFFLYAPDPHDIHAAHSIYFQALGEHGFVGLALYLLLLGLTWRSAAWIARHSLDRPELEWAQQLATMIQASFVGFAVGGAFLSLLYFDVPYYLMAVIIATRVLVAKRQHTVRHAVQGELESPHRALRQP
ncbi:putative O-glycosylation ligase, exosortase A system-associated [Rugamonas sp. FT82W]|uniref:Putative O-glycosylation ligase, exosortase A system-associated n=1 Tax=Duganella vulcania TaxID=2692166 RepID=A0A845G6N4_9BURK|nr:putative O-glycosylation ligase, exosortase A system-associated [Duganella vulcania]MYM89531.1 putative O-glycosylation ligase, exosortase A system-associated [Duganella vulcania]